MAFQYPEMTPARGFGEIEIAEAKDRGTWVPHRDRFMVDILTLFYSKPIPNATRNDWVGSEPQPWHIIANRASIPTSFSSPHIGPSPYSGLRELLFGPPISAEEPASAIRRWGFNPYLGSHVYVQGPNTDYALLIDCQGFACTGHVHLNDNHMQYRFMIPIEAIAHSTEFIAAMNSKIRSWISK